MVRKNAAAADEDPIMYEVDDDSGNKPLGKPSRKKDKGKDLLNKFSGGDGEEEGSSGTRKPRELTAKEKKAKDQKVLSNELWMCPGYFASLLMLTFCVLSIFNRNTAWVIPAKKRKGRLWTRK